MKENLFSVEEIPCNVLSKYGLTYDMLEDLPLPGLENIISGKVTPVLPIKVDTDDGHTILSKARFSLTRTNNGVEVIFYPVLEHANIGQFDEQQQSLLKEGKAIMAEITKDGEKVMSFVQLDNETNQVLSAPSLVIGRNLEVLKNVANLSTPEVNVIQNGEPLTILSDDEEVSVGIDLINTCTGIRIENGDAEKWKAAVKREWDKYSFGINGCWITDENGDLSYVPEDQYTEELLNEQKRRVGMQQHR